MLALRFSGLLLVTAAAAVICVGSAAGDAGDQDAPQIVLETPSDGEGFYQGQKVQAAYGCVPGALGWPVIFCVGDVPLGEHLDTSSVGLHAFTVRAEDYAGAVTTVTHTYTVFDVIPPAITIAAPADGAVYPFGAQVTVDYGCDDGPGGSGILACLGSLPDGSPLPTDRLGTFSVDVTAFDGAGNSSTLRHTYQVVDETPPTISIAQPAAPAGDRVPVYTRNQVVYADYSCSDGDGSGVVSCLGGVPSGSPLDTSTVGTHVFTVLARDAGRNLTTMSRSYQVVYAFEGFTAPLAPLPTLAAVKAGEQVPVKFSLHGDAGPGVVAGVTSQPISCASATVTDQATPANGTLGYSAGPDRYTYQWSTDRAWLGTCRQLAVALDDGTVHRANVRLTK